MFEEINDILRRECHHLRNEVDPLWTILKTTDLELPLYYALCNVTDDSPCKVAKGLSELSREKEIRFPEAVPKAAARLTFDTVLFCAYHAVPFETRMGCFSRNIQMGWESVFESRHETMERMRWVVKFVHDRLYPVVRGPSSDLLAWDPRSCYWHSIGTDDERKFWKSRFSRVCHEIKYFEGFTRLPDRTRNAFEFRRDWLTPLVNAKLNGQVREVPIGNERPGDYNEFKRVYGRNVPEYYFFEECSMESDEDDLLSSSDDSMEYDEGDSLESDLDDSMESDEYDLGESDEEDLKTIKL